LLSDQRIPLPPFPGAKAKGAVLWTTGTVPADNIHDVQGEQRAAGMSLKGGSVLRITEFGPGFVSPMHRTLSIDYAVVLSGQLELVLDGGEAVKLRPGDAITQRGTNHAWRNSSPDQPCRIMIAMIQAHAVTVAGKRLRQTPTWRMFASVLAGMFRGTFTYQVAKEKSRPPEFRGVWSVVTSHDKSGKAVVLSEQGIDPFACPSLSATRTALWNTERVPADNSGDENAATAVGSTTFSGSAFNLIELSPGSIIPTRRSPSIDYCIFLCGQAELMLDDGNRIVLSAGDAAVLHRTRQAWRNLSTNTSCKIAVCTIGARHPGSGRTNN
jgi:quercetin dioxygenase-like cupin family protein